MKKLLLFCSFALMSQFLTAQCTPDASATTWGLHPLPSLDLNGVGAVPETPACIGTDYSYTFSLVIPSSFDLPGVGSLGVTQAVVTEVTGLPSGLTFGDCSPSGNCTIPGGTTGCFSIIGIPDNTNSVGNYEIAVKVTVSGTVLVIPQSIDLSFPPISGFNPLNFPIEPYVIKLKASGQCTSSSVNPLENELSVSANTPNPFSNTTVIEVEAQKKGDYTFTVTDLLGKKIMERAYTFSTGNNRIEFDGSNLSNGVYIYSLSSAVGTISNKMVVRK